MGIYIHIPFCKQACHYCNFHFNVNLDSRDTIVNSILKEIEMQKEYLDGSIDTIYFGGGTPSLLNANQINLILEQIYKYNKCNKSLEITFEANPDDLQSEKLIELKSLGINRLSIGIQSFNDEILKYLNRSHNSEMAIKCVKEARKIGFNNINIDIIYSIPKSNIQFLKSDLKIGVNLFPEHISCYNLTIEKNTVFGNWYSRGKLKTIGENNEANQYNIVVNYLSKNNYEQYEVSNFCLPNKYSKHNTNYWKKGNYLGIGPSAHSYNGFSRQFNISNNKKYIENINKNQLPSRKELLTKKDHINEYLMTNIRTIWGCDLEYLKYKYNFEFKERTLSYIHLLQSEDLLVNKGKVLKLTNKGFLLADKITSKLFI